MVLDEPVAATRSIESLMLTTRTARVALLALAGCAFAFGVNEASIVAMSSSVAAGLGVPVATIEPHDNNPLKVSASVEEALLNLLLRPAKQYAVPI
ncbi:type VI secretion system-associated FHA domain protein, partial [uncultured Demequina sp.]|uniref:type VI secretion system-associated FHA domain protein n=1 Tax=uncultured Demequina sp. TaxID=693499 RepID=UPI0025E8881C